MPAASSPTDGPTLLISPCSSHTARNWSAERYAAVADYAVAAHRMRVVLVGGRSSIESADGRRDRAAARDAARQPDRQGHAAAASRPDVAKHRAAVAGLGPRAHGHHGGTAGHRPVCRHQSARAGPYYSRQWCVDKYDEAAQKYLGKPAAEIPWTTKIERSGVMDLIGVDDVTAKLDALILTGFAKMSA